MASKKQLDRLLRVRTHQLNLTRVAEAEAQDRRAKEANLADRIARLALNVAPAPATGSGLDLVAVAHFRSRLHASAEVAQARLIDAERAADRAVETTREARRDQSAIEKLMAVADADAALSAIRALEVVPPMRNSWHDPC